MVPLLVIGARVGLRWSSIWDQAGKADSRIRAAGGRLIVNGCEFMPGGKRAIILEKGLMAATIFGCTFRGPQPIEDQSGAEVQIGLNTNHWAVAMQLGAGSARAHACGFPRPRGKQDGAPRLTVSWLVPAWLRPARAPVGTREGACAPRKELHSYG